jgi:hypothetical protein
MLSSKFVKSLKSKDAVEQFVGDADQAPRVVLYSDKGKVPSLFKALSTLFSERAAFGIAKLSAFPADAKKAASSSGAQVVVTPLGGGDASVYSGNFSVAEVGHFIAGVIGAGGGGGGGGGEANAKAKPAKKTPPAAVTPTSVSTQAALVKECYEKKGLCVLLLSPSSTPSTEHAKAFAAAATSARASSAKLRTSFVTVDTSGAAAAFADAFGVAAADAAVVVLNAKRKKFKVAAAVDAASVDALISGIALGDVALTKLDALPILGGDDSGSGDAEASCGGSGDDDAADDGLCTAPPS